MNRRPVTVKVLEALKIDRSLVQLRCFKARMHAKSLRNKCQGIEREYKSFE